MRAAACARGAAAVTFTLLIDEDRYGKRNSSRLNAEARNRWPERILVEGTIEQARYVAETLSFIEAGCDEFWYVEGDPNRL